PGGAPERQAGGRDQAFPARGKAVGARAGMKLPIYLDYSATTPVDPRVAAKMIPYLTEFFGNPASRSHAFGWAAEEGVEEGGGRVDIDMTKLRADLLTLTAHKMYGPKGIGALYVRRKPRVRIEAQIHGGGHERGFRSGTLATHQIVGFGEAARLAKLEMASDNERIRAMRDRLWKSVQTMEEVYLNGDLERRIPHNLNVAFNFVEGESLVMAVKDIAVSSGSACTSASLEPSYVLRALGRNDELAHSSIRITLGRFTTEQEVDYAAELLK